MIRLHGYWRSSAAYRVRIALALKGIAHDQVNYDLRKGEQGDPDYLALNPQGLVPALETGSEVLWQSLAILEWIEETYPKPALLPSVPADRAIVRAMADTICCDIHPLNNLRVLRSLRENLSASEEDVQHWIARWITSGLSSVEQRVAQVGGEFAFGDTPTIADCCLVPQVYSAERFKVDLAPFPTIRRVIANCAEMPPFQKAHPSGQLDADHTARDAV